MITHTASTEELLIACRKGGSSEIELRPDAKPHIRDYLQRHKAGEGLIDYLDEHFPSGWWRYRGHYDGAVTGPEVRSLPYRESPDRENTCQERPQRHILKLFDGRLIKRREKNYDPSDGCGPRDEIDPGSGPNEV